MDLLSVLRYVADHNQNVIGGLIVIIIVTTILLFVRSIGQEKSGSSASSHSGGPVEVDMGAIEAAVKRALDSAKLGSSGVSNSNATGGAGSTPGAEASGSVVSPAEIAERDAKIQELAREIDRLNLSMQESAAGTGFGGTAAAPGSDPRLGELQNKIGELQAKLTEYEIIEDDIADLSRFKDENAELRSELEALKKSASSSAKAPAESASPSAPPAAVTSSPVVETSPAPILQAVDVVDPIPSIPSAAAVADEIAAAMFEAPSVVANSTPPTEEKPFDDDITDVIDPAFLEAAGKPELPEAVAKDPLKEFANAVEIQSPVQPGDELIEIAAVASVGDGSSVLDASLDTAKLLNEVSSLSDGEQTDEDVMAGELDTEKLLKEAGSMDPNEKGEPSPFEDDLLAEFKDSQGGGQG